MSESPSSRQSYIRQNLPPLIVGVVALLVIVGGLFVVADRVRDDDDAQIPAAAAASSEGLFRDGPFVDGLAEQLEDAFGNGVLLGVSVEEMDDGLRVNRVLRGSAADDAGIEVGDEILEVDGERVRSALELREAVAAVSDDEYELRLRRDGDEQTLTVRRDDLMSDMFAALLEALAEQRLNPDEPEFNFGFDNFDFGQFGFRAPDGLDRSDEPAPDPFFTSRLRPMLGVTVVQTDEGLRVVQVERGSIAAAAGLESGDVILEADGRAVRGIDDLRAALPSTTLQPGVQSSIVTMVELLVRRGDRELTLEARFPQGAPLQAPRFQIPSPSPSLPNATPTPDLMTERLFEELDDLELFLDSDEFLDRLGERLRGRVEAFLDEALEEQSSDQADRAEDAPASLAGLDVFRGSVDALNDVQITLGGPRGAISFVLTEDTAMVGATPQVGAASTVAANADREAVLVLTTN